MIKVTVIENNHFTLEGMANFVRRSEGLELVAATRTLEEFDELEVGADVVLLGLRLSGRLEASAEVKQLAEKGMRVLIMSIDNAPAAVMAAIAAGAGGYLTTRTDPADVHEAIRSIHHGVLHLSPELAGYIRDARPVLSPREIEVLDLAHAGKSNKNIAAALGISVKSVENNIADIRAKLPGITRHRPTPPW